MKAYENKTELDIKKMIAEKKEALRQFRFSGAGSKVKNVKLAKTTKKEIAVMMTVLSQRSKN